jgi:hypothetical protein
VCQENSVRADRNLEKSDAGPGPPHTLDRNSQDFEQEVGVPAGHATLHGDALLAIDLL